MEQVKDAISFSQEVQLTANTNESTLLEAMVDLCTKYDIPFENITRFQENEDSPIKNLITSQLKDKLQAECMNSGTMRGTNRPVSCLDILFGE